jgi:hypothetical protein
MCDTDDDEPEVSIPSVLRLSEPPVVGRTYLVPCVVAGFHHEYLPVQTEFPHDDASNGFGDQPHYHVDYRFLPQDWYDRYLANEEVGGKPSNLWLLVFWQIRLAGLGDTTMRAMECLREAPPPASLDTYFGFMLERLEPKFKDATLPACKKCPHKGTPLGSYREVNGVLLCPGHGLSWDAKTGRMIPRTSPCASI